MSQAARLVNRSLRRRGDLAAVGDCVVVTARRGTWGGWWRCGAVGRGALCSRRLSDKLGGVLVSAFLLRLRRTVWMSELPTRRRATVGYLDILVLGVSATPGRQWW